MSIARQASVPGGYQFRFEGTSLALTQQVVPRPTTTPTGRRELVPPILNSYPGGTGEHSGGPPRLLAEALRPRALAVRSEQSLLLTSAGDNRHEPQDETPDLV